MKHTAYALVLLLCLGCRGNEPQSEERAAVPGVAPSAGAPEPAAHREGLPRTVVGITLGMSRAAAEGTLIWLTVVKCGRRTNPLSCSVGFPLFPPVQLGRRRRSERDDSSC